MDPNEMRGGGGGGGGLVVYSLTDYQACNQPT